MFLLFLRVSRRQENREAMQSGICRVFLLCPFTCANWSERVQRGVRSWQSWINVPMDARRFIIGSIHGHRIICTSCTVRRFILVSIQGQRMICTSCNAGHQLTDIRRRLDFVHVKTFASEINIPLWLGRGDRSDGRWPWLAYV